MLVVKLRVFGLEVCQLTFHRSRLSSLISGLEAVIGLVRHFPLVLALGGLGLESVGLKLHWAVDFGLGMFVLKLRSLEKPGFEVPGQEVELDSDTPGSEVEASVEAS